MQRKSILYGYIYIILSGVIFGCMPLMAKHIYADGVNPITLVLLRNFLSLPFLGILAVLCGHSLKINIKALPQIGGIALMGCCITPLLLFSSYRYIASGTATVFHFVYPAAVILIEIIFMRSKIRMGNIVSILICVIGIIMFYTPGQEISLTGSGIALLSGVTYAIYIVLLSSFRYKEISGFVFSFYVALICSVVLFAVCLAGGTLSLPSSVPGFLLCVLFAVLINVGAVVLFQRGTFLIGGQRAAILSTVEPITSIFIGALVFDEIILLRTGFGAFLVILASILIAFFDMREMKKKDV